MVNIINVSTIIKGFIGVIIKYYYVDKYMDSVAILI